MSYKIIYIDEQDDAQDEFKDFVEQKDTTKQFRVECFPPAPSLDEMLIQIRKEGADALVSDYQLNEHIKDLGYTVPYTGVELVNEYAQERINYPCFVITSFPADAANTSEDVNTIYVKKVLADNDNADLDFLERIRIQVDHYRKKISDAEQRITELIKIKADGALTLDQEEELIKLDTFIESSINKTLSIPSDLKKTTNEDRLADLLHKVDQLIGKIGDGK